MLSFLTARFASHLEQANLETRASHIHMLCIFRNMACAAQAVPRSPFKAARF
jgi:hypothetical protein